jgi:Na+-translocating ferredoxin:NAD+ oxidoreductase RNF subunit RnfB
LVDLFRILYAFASVSGLGILFGVGLAVASRALAVKKNELLASLEEALPGLNCGACGYAGCAVYAEAIAHEEESSLHLCGPGGEDAANAVADIMGVEIAFTRQKMVAQVHCRGGSSTAKYSFEYNGVRDCNALYAMYGGNKVCKFGCLALGSCIRVCPVDAISYDEDGLVWVDKDLCVTCDKCIDICPTRVMEYIPYDADYLVACNSTDRGRDVKNCCSVGCIGCKICEKKSPEGGFKVDNFLARIDFKTTGVREPAASACPPKCIVLNKP